MPMVSCQNYSKNATTEKYTLNLGFNLASRVACQNISERETKTSALELCGDQL